MRPFFCGLTENTTVSRGGYSGAAGTANQIFAFLAVFATFFSQRTRRGCIRSVNFSLRSLRETRRRIKSVLK